MITGVHISSPEMVIHRDDGKNRPLPKFIKNQIVQAKILKVLPEGKAQILVNHQKIVVKTALLLKPGEDVQLKVLQEKDNVILKLIDPVQKMTTRQVSSLVSLFSKDETMLDMTGTKLTHVKSLLYDMALKSDKMDETFLPRLIEKSGMIWEKKVAGVLLATNPASPDIKSGLDILLQQDVKAAILKELFIASPQKLDALKTAASFSETIENFQLLNSNSSESGRFLLPFPIFNESVFNFGQLLIDTGGKSKKEDKDADKLINVSFLLDMTRLGPLRADFSILKKQISGHFLLQDAETCAYVKSMIPELKKRLAAIEYQAHNIDCSISKKDEIQPSSFIETLVKAGDDQVLNIVI